MPEIVTSPLILFIVATVSYLLGSVPFGIVMARAFGLGNLREIGSGNIGATNVLRTGNRLAAFLTLALDAGKGAIAVLVARALVGEDAAQAAGGAAFLGHLYPVFLQFRGGKGVATFLGTFIALAWPVGIAACATWLATAVAFRISSLSALMAALLAPVFAWWLGYGDIVGLSAALAMLVWVSHRENIQRLINGTEPRIGKR